MSLKRPNGIHYKKQILGSDKVNSIWVIVNNETGKNPTAEGSSSIIMLKIVLNL
jgi:hypothetical protein